MKGINEFRQLEKDSLPEELIKYMELELPNFTSSNEFNQILKKKKNENQHTQALTVFLTNQCQSKFNFTRENSQQGNRTVDIGVYFGSNLFFTIEAKILPTPPSKNRKEYEYVYGEGGGIQRFKDLFHGMDNNDRAIQVNGMIAYIKENEFHYWHERVNSWVEDAKWDNSEKLKTVYFNVIGKLKSNHIRKDNTSIELHHFWVKV